MGINDFYPENARNVPADLTAPKKGYYIRGVFVLGGIMLFLAIHLALTCFSVWLFYFLTVDGIPVSGLITLLLKGGSMFFAVMLFWFLLKGLILMRSTITDNLVEIFEEDQPRLFAFIRQLCIDTNNPFPGKVYVSADINAAVFYNGTLQSLFWPVKKNLIIGLGLVNCVNLSEFKAILAHEFGHFSQKSMRLGSYIYVANQIIFDMVYKRDKWDEFLTNWARMDIRVSFFAWILIGFTKAMRFMFEALYKGINLLNAALSREMEFHADLVSVSLTGSDAIINGLARLEHATMALGETASNLRDAAQNHLYSNDLFLHHQKNIDILNKKVETEPIFKPEVKDGITWLFQENKQNVTDMYASHPAHYQREQNAKQIYIAVPEDGRSPWLLFDNKEELAETMTRAFYRMYLNQTGFLKLNPAAQVQDFIAEEMNETELDAKYKGFYEGHFILIDEDNVVAPRTELTSKQELDEYLYNPYIESQLKESAEELKAIEEIGSALSKEKKTKMIVVQGKELSHEAAAEKWKTLTDAWQEKRNDWMKVIDNRVYYQYLYISARLGAEKEAAFRAEYTFLKKLQILYNTLAANKGYIIDTINAVMKKGQLEADEASVYRKHFNTVYANFTTVVEAERDTPMPGYKRMEKFKNLHDFLMDGKQLNNSVDKLSNEWINEYLTLSTDVIRRLERLYHKNIASILAMQDALGHAYFEENGKGGVVFDDTLRS